MAHTRQSPLANAGRAIPGADKARQPRGQAICDAIRILGQGFICSNPGLLSKLAGGKVDAREYYRQLLRLAYRFIFLSVLENRKLSRDVPDGLQGMCSVIRTLQNCPAENSCRHIQRDLWKSMRPGNKEKRQAPPFDGFLWSGKAIPLLERLRLDDIYLLEAIRTLVFNAAGPVRNGVPEPGSALEFLLELRPQIIEGQFLLVAAGGERKKTGSYYTPPQLVAQLLETALDPVIEKALQSPDPELSLLNLKICDPACGCGHFLLPAAKRLAVNLARLRENALSDAGLRRAMRDVASRCIYGMDINPIALELCRLAFWLEICEPGPYPMPHLVCANTLLGTTADVICQDLQAHGSKNGESANALRKQFERIIGRFANLPSSTEEMILREKTLRERQKTPAWRRIRFLYDLWTACFILPGCAPASGGATFEVSRQDIANFARGGRIAQGVWRAVRNLARDWQFFHYEIMFPEVAAKGGFDVILGNPPWEHNELKEREWLAAHGREDLAKNAGIRRKEAIACLEKEDPALFSFFRAEQCRIKATNHFYAKSGNYPFCGCGRVNYFALFAEWMRKSLNSHGRLGCIVPSGIATYKNTQFFFQDLVKSKSLVSLFDFENKGIFPGVHQSYNFCLLTAGSGAMPLAEQSEFVFFARKIDDLHDKNKCFTLSAADFELINPNTVTCPIFRKAKDLILSRAVYRRVPVLIRKGHENPWQIKLRQGLFNMTDDSRLFRSRQDLEKAGWALCGNCLEKNGQRYLPLYEGKMLHHYNHRWATFRENEQGEPEARETAPEELGDPQFFAMPRYWLAEDAVNRQLENMGCKRGWLAGFRIACRTTDSRTVVGGVFPKCAVGNSVSLWISDAEEAPFLPAILSSLVCDFFARLKIGGANFNSYLAEQIAVLPPEILRRSPPWSNDCLLAEWLAPRIAELCYTSVDMRPFARDLGHGGEPFTWDEKRRKLLRAELDAAFFHLYLPCGSKGNWLKSENESANEHAELVDAFRCPRDAVKYILESFDRKTEREKLEWRMMKKDILANYDALGKMIALAAQLRGA